MARILLFIVITISVALVFFSPGSARDARAFSIEYNVKIGSVEGHLFHITTHIRNIHDAALDLSLPAWTPGWYGIDNYATNLLRFRITDVKGNLVPHIMTRKQTWRVATKGISEINIDYDYRADKLALNQAAIKPDFAFFTGIQLFLEPAGHRNLPITVRFDLPPGWKIVSALKETSDPMAFTASDYDELVDSPVEMGKFDVTKFDVDGKPHYLVTQPPGKLPTDKAEEFARLLAKVAHTEGSIFGGLPYEKYVYFYFFMPSDTGQGGALEHANSQTWMAYFGGEIKPGDLIGGAAHEFFHVWNVKRIRPIEMWPYDYSRENETPLLWVSEGFTSYLLVVSPTSFRHL